MPETARVVLPIVGAIAETAQEIALVVVAEVLVLTLEVVIVVRQTAVLLTVLLTAAPTAASAAARVMAAAKEATVPAAAAAATAAAAPIAAAAVVTVVVAVVTVVVVTVVAVVAAPTVGPIAAANMMKSSRFLVLFAAACGIFLVGFFVVYYIHVKNVPRAPISALQPQIQKGKILTAYNAAVEHYFQLGDVSDLLQSIDALKQVALDTTVPLQTRVSDLNILASAYSVSGNNQTVLAEVFKGAPWSIYFVPGNPSLSIRQLYKYSYALRPTSVAAIHIAQWYTASHQGQAATTTKQYATFAVTYLNRADTAAIGDARADSTFASSTQYVDYRYWRAVVIGRLAGLIGQPYLGESSAEYQSFISFAQKSPLVLARVDLLYARFQYANFLQSQLKDTTDAKSQLDLLAQQLNAISDPSANGFVIFLRNISASGAKGRGGTILQYAFSISPSFKATVNTILASLPASSQTATTTQSVQ
jgi:hypothetical protein